MGDYTSGTATIYAFNPRKRLKLERAIEDAGFGTEWTDQEDLSGDGPWSFSGPEVRLDANNELAEALTAIDRSIVLAVSTSPKYEFLGGLTMYAPRLGSYVADCDDSGNALFTASDVRGLLAMPKAKRERALGAPWERRIEKLRAA